MLAPVTDCSFVTCLSPSRCITIIFTIIDQFSKAVHFVALPQLTSAKENADLLVHHVFRLHGLPSDMVRKAFCSAVGASGSLFSGYHPQTNGPKKVGQTGVGGCSPLCDLGKPLLLKLTVALSCNYATIVVHLFFGPSGLFSLLDFTYKHDISPHWQLHCVKIAPLRHTELKGALLPYLHCPGAFHTSFTPLIGKVSVCIIFIASGCEQTKDTKSDSNSVQIRRVGLYLFMFTFRY